jgi:hypothetical protein
MVCHDFDAQLNSPSPEGGIRLGVEVDVGFAATHSLDPDILDAGLNEILILRRDEHPRRERLFISIPLPVEIGNQHNRIVISHGGF